jgi:hypothetical protein
VAEKLKGERAKIAAEEAKKAKLALGDDLEQKAKELASFRACSTARVCGEALLRLPPTFRIRIRIEPASMCRAL